VSFCASNCAGGVGDDPGVRAAVCVPHIEPCGDVSIPADDICPPGYTQCTGTTTGDDTVGQYTMTCSM
jgi:hypothetical protein